MVDSLGKVSFVLVFLCLFLTLSLVGSSILGLVIDSSDDILFNNRTEASNLGGRLESSIFFMNFNKDSEGGGYVQENTISNNYGNNSGATWNSSCGVTDAGNDLGGCFEFDGTTSRINQVDFELGGYENFTWSAWVKASTDSSSGVVIGRCWDTGSVCSGADPERYVPISIAATTGRFVSYYSDNNWASNSLHTWTTDYTLDDGWHLYTAVTLIEDQEIKLYIDGEEMTTDNNNLGTVTSAYPLDGFDIGALWTTYGASHTSQFNGSIDDVRFFDRALSLSEIQNLYNGTVNNTNYMGKYSNEGDFKSLVFYNDSSSYWNISQSIADSDGSAEVNDLCQNDANCVSYWNLDEGGENHLHTYVGGYVEVADSDSLDLVDNLTFAMWVNPVSFAASRPLIDKFYDGSGRSYYLTINAGGELSLGLGNTAGSGTQTVSSSSGMGGVANEWVFVSVTWDKSDGKAYYYKNGQFISSGGTATADVYQNNEELRIARNYASSYFYSGRIDEVMIFNRSLSQTELEEIYDLSREEYSGDSGLVSYYRFEGDYTDEQGLNNGTANNNTALGRETNDSKSDNLGLLKGQYAGSIESSHEATGLTSGAIEFDGTSDFIQVERNSNLEPQIFTLSAWIKPDVVSDGSNYFDIIQKGQTSHAAEYYSYRLTLYGGYAQFVAVCDSWGGDGLTGTIPISVDEWQHLTATFNGSLMSLYVNGVLDDTLANSGTISYYDTPLNIGRRYTLGDSYFDGTIDEVLIYNDSLTASEVTELYKAGLSQHADTNVTLETRVADSYNVSDSGLVGLWGMNGDDGDVAVDETGINNGTWVNAYSGMNSGTAGNGGYFDGTGDYVDALVPSYSNSHTGAISVFVKLDPSFSSTGAVFSTNDRNDNKWFYARISTARQLSFGTYVNTHSPKSNGMAGTTILDLDTWYHIVYQSDGSTWAAYINGKEESLTVGAGSNLGHWFADVPGRDDIVFGAESYKSSYPSKTYFKGAIDEVRIYNRSLSQSEIQNLYELGSHHIEWGNWETQSFVDETYFTSSDKGNFIQMRNVLTSNDTDVSPYVISQNISVIPDSESPVITLLTPQHNYNYSQNITGINFTVTDGSGVDSCWYSTNSSVNVSTSCTSNITGITDYIEGKNNWTLYANDTLGQLTTEQINFTIDLTNVSINATSPDNLTEENNATVNFTANVSDIGGSGVRNASLIITWLNGSNYYDGEITLTPGTPLQVISKTVELVEGVFNWFISIFDWAGNQNFIDNRTITVDLTAPNYTSYTTLVGSNQVALTNATLDPETIIYVNITVEDPTVLNATTGVGDVYLIYNYTMHNGTTGDASILMLNESNEFYANFTTVPHNATYQYYVRMNDTVGNVNSTVNTTVYNYWDCTWNLSGTILEEISGFYEEKSLGNYTVANTGDSNYSGGCVNDFTNNYLSGTFSVDYYGSDFPSSTRMIFSPSTFTLSPGDSQEILVTGGFPNYEGTLTETPDISITSDINDTEDNLNVRYVNTTMLVAEGVALWREIVAPTSNLNVYLTESNTSIRGYIRNLGGDGTANNTAWNVSLNWNYNSALVDLIVGNTSANHTSLANSTRQYLNNTLVLTNANIVSMSSNVPYSVNLSGYGYDNSSGNSTIANSSSTFNSLNITFLCYNASDGVCVTGCGHLQDSDCSAPTSSEGTSTSSSGGGGGGGASGDKFSKSEGTFELLNGEDSEFYFTIENSDNKTKTVGEIFPKGDNAQYITILSGKGKKINGKGKINITVRIDAPAYFNRGKHLIQFDVILKDSLGTSETVQKFMTLYIVELPREEADEMLSKADEYLQWMESLNLSLKQFDEHFDQMNGNYEAIYFLGVEESFDNLEEIALSAKEYIELNSTLLEQINHAREFNIDVTETRKLYLLAAVIFNRGDYILAKQRINEAQSTYAYETKGEFGVVYYTKKNPLQALGAVFLFITTSLAGTYLSRRTYLKRKVKLLEKEEKLLLQLMKVIQGYTFNDNKMSMGEYSEAMTQYEKKLSTTIQERIKTETAIISLSHFQRKKEALSMERGRLITMMKGLQEDYLVKGTLETRVYENMLKTYAHRLTEVQEQIAFIDTRKMLKKKNLKKFGGGRKEGFDYA